MRHSVLSSSARPIDDCVAWLFRFGHAGYIIAQRPLARSRKQPVDKLRIPDLVVWTARGGAMRPVMMSGVDADDDDIALYRDVGLAPAGQVLEPIEMPSFISSEVSHRAGGTVTLSTVVYVLRHYDWNKVILPACLERLSPSLDSLENSLLGHLLNHVVKHEVAAALDNQVDGDRVLLGN